MADCPQVVAKLERPNLEKMFPFSFYLHCTLYGLHGLYYTVHVYVVKGIATTVKPVSSRHCHETTCLEGPLVFGKKPYVSMQINLSPETICLQRTYCYGQCGGLSRQVQLCMYIYKHGGNYN